MTTNLHGKHFKSLVLAFGFLPFIPLLAAASGDVFPAGFKPEAQEVTFVQNAPDFNITSKNYSPWLELAFAQENADRYAWWADPVPLQVPNTDHLDAYRSSSQAALQVLPVTAARETLVVASALTIRVAD